MLRTAALVLVALFGAGCEVQTNINSPLLYGATLDVAVSPNGHYVILWSDGHCTNFSCRIVARAYDPAGAPTTGEIVVSPTTNGLYEGAQVAVADTGAFVVVFARYIYNPANPLLSDQIYWRQFSASGTPLGGTTFVDYGIYPAVSEAANGDFYVSYTSLGGRQDFIYVKRFGVNGMLLGPRITVATVNIGTPASQIQLQCDGDFLVTWNQPAQTLQRYFSQGVPNGAPVQVEGTPSSSSESLMYRSNGSFGIVTRLAGQYYLNRFDEGGNRTAPELLATAAPSVISANPCGDYALLYRDKDTLYGRLYSYRDVPIVISQVNTSGPNNGGYFIGLGSGVAVGAWDRSESFPKNNVIHRRLQSDNRLLSSLGISGSAGPDQTICFFPISNVGQPLCPKSTVIGSPPVPGYTYSWSPTTYLNNPNVAQPTVTHPGPYSMLFSVTYTLTVRGPCNCQVPDLITVNFRPGEL